MRLLKEDEYIALLGRGSNGYKDSSISPSSSSSEKSPPPSSSTSSPSPFDDIPCNTILDVDVYDVCGDWCPFTLGWAVQREAAPLLRASYAAKGSACKAHISHAHSSGVGAGNVTSSRSRDGGSGSESRLKVVWHVRTMQLDTDKAVITCASCQAEYLPRVISLLRNALTTLHASGTSSTSSTSSTGGTGGTSGSSGSSIPSGMSHTVIVKAHQGKAEAQFRPHFGDDVRLVLSNNVKDLVCEFLTADVLVSTGSSFPSMVVKFAGRDKPILIEERRHNANIAQKKLQWITAPEDSLHLQNGVLTPENTGETGGISLEDRLKQVFSA